MEVPRQYQFVLTIMLLALALPVHVAAAGQPQPLSVTKRDMKAQLGFSLQEFSPTLGNMVSSAGSAWVRSDIDDKGDGAGPSVDKFSGYQNYGQKLLGIIDEFTVSPSIRNNFTLNDWKNTVATVASKFKGVVSAYEIWNEPDLSEYYFGYMDGTPAHYVDMLKAAYVIIKTVDPSAIVVGGVVSDPLRHEKFITDILSLNATKYVDVFSIHLYYYEDWTIDYGSLVARASQLTGRPIWVTETGEDSQGSSKSQGVQADYMRARFSQLIVSKVKPGVIFWYRLYDWASDEKSGSTKGLITSNFTPKTAYYVFENYTLGTSS